MTTVAVARHAMATRFEIVLHGENEVGLRAAAEEALDEIERLEAQLNLYQPTSEISHINARAAFEPVRVEPSFFRLLRTGPGIEFETVYIPEADRGTLCVSSQVGCTLTCRSNTSSI